MRATQTLPPDYKEIGVIDISKKRTLLLISLLGLILMGGFCALFYWLLLLIRPVQLNSDAMNHLFGSRNVLVQTAGLLFVIALMLVLHEALHGVCFWVFTCSRPKFAFKGYYAYASIPGWYLPKVPYLVSALMPFLFITVAGLIFLSIVPATWFIPLLIIMVANAAGSVGDLVVAVWLLGRRKGVLAQDRGDAVTLFEPIPSEE
jgi:CBS domain containing-hemolysin-like protein